MFTLPAPRAPLNQIFNWGGTNYSTGACPVGKQSLSFKVECISYSFKVESVYSIRKPIPSGCNEFRMKNDEKKEE
jgi:hypothetical protein